jgi:hypothetical protein
LGFEKIGDLNIGPPFGAFGDKVDLELADLAISKKSIWSSETPRERKDSEIMWRRELLPTRLMPVRTLMIDVSMNGCIASR